jgi:hypothetical protein
MDCHGKPAQSSVPTSRPGRPVGKVHCVHIGRTQRRACEGHYSRTCEDVEHASAARDRGAPERVQQQFGIALRGVHPGRPQQPHGASGSSHPTCQTTRPAVGVGQATAHVAAAYQQGSPKGQSAAPGFAASGGEHSPAELERNRWPDRTGDRAGAAVRPARSQASRSLPARAGQSPLHDSARFLSAASGGVMPASSSGLPLDAGEAIATRGTPRVIRRRTP